MNKDQDQRHDIGGPTTGGMTPKDPTLVGKESEGSRDPGQPTTGGLQPKDHLPAATPTKRVHHETVAAPAKKVAAKRKR